MAFCEKAFDAYCRKVLKNKLVSYKRQVKKERERRENILKDARLYMAHGDIRIVSVIYLDGIKYSFSDDALFFALKKLNFPYMRILLYYYGERVTDKEIGKRLNMPQSTVQWQRKKALQEVKKRMRGGT